MSLKKEITAIVLNPEARDGQAGKNWPWVEKTLREHGIRFDTFETQNDGNIVRSVKEIAEAGYGRIVGAGGRIKIMLDEWGDWLIEWDASDPWLQMGTLMDAISAAEQLQVFMAHSDRILMAGLAQAVNVIHALFLTNSAGGGSELVKTPTFYVFKMFVPHHIDNARWAPGTLDSQKIEASGQPFPVLSYAATVNDAQQVNISLVNVDLSDTRTIHITLNGGEASYVVSSAEVITGDAKDSYNDFGQDEQVNIQELPASSYEICDKTLNVTLPSKSVVMLTLTPR